ncbi:MAG: hypothetical protein ACE5GD_10310 [Candidatus Geothermarchaeales archaeon]
MSTTGDYERARAYLWAAIEELAEIIKNASRFTPKIRAAATMATCINALNRVVREGGIGEREDLATILSRIDLPEDLRGIVMKTAEEIDKQTKREEKRALKTLRFSA